LRLAITNNELIKIRCSFGRAQEYNSGAHKKESTKFRNQNFKNQEWEFLPRVH
jgi:hypothetical protein